MPLEMKPQRLPVWQGSFLIQRNKLPALCEALNYYTSCGYSYFYVKYVTEVGCDVVVLIEEFGVSRSPYAIGQIEELCNETFKP
jgi:hypothetical protein